mgnify:CR=1 FL=1
MRDATITKIRTSPTPLYEVDLYYRGSWVDSRRGSKSDVEKYASNYVNRHAPHRMIMS